jgi:NAD(P)-dependent dehydrogenase (short-subunit alcohol dehydrogenase family)
MQLIATCNHLHREGAIMLLRGQTAIVYGGSGAIGGAAAGAFAREGAKVFLVGRTLQKLQARAQEIVSRGGAAEFAVVDVLDERAVEHHAEAVARETGGIDIALNAVGFFHVQGTPFAELSLPDFMLPVETYAKAAFITAKAASRFMAQRGSGVVMNISTPGSRLPGIGYLGYGAACAVTEGMTRLLAAELALRGIRVVCLQPHAIPEALAKGSHSRQVFQPAAERAGLTVEDMLQGAAEGTLLKRLPTLGEVADVAAFMASDHARAMTGAVVNMTCGALVD